VLEYGVTVVTVWKSSIGKDAGEMPTTNEALAEDPRMWLREIEEDRCM